MARLAGLTLALFILIAAAIAVRANLATSPRHANQPIKPLVTYVHRDGGSLPEYIQGSVDQQLDRALKIPGVRGLLEGVTGPPSFSEASLYSGGPSIAVTDFPFRVISWTGTSPAPYQVGSVVTLRVPGGTHGAVGTIYEGAPVVVAQQHLFVFVRNQGTVAGGNTNTVLVASDGTDVVDVQNDFVHGQGSWKALSEDLQTFKRHFERAN